MRHQANGSDALVFGPLLVQSGSQGGQQMALTYKSVVAQTPAYNSTVYVGNLTPNTSRMLTFPFTCWSHRSSTDPFFFFVGDIYFYFLAEQDLVPFFQ